MMNRRNKKILMLKYKILSSNWRNWKKEKKATQNNETDTISVEFVLTKIDKSKLSTN